MTVSELPALNASLNSISTIFIAMGWYFIRHGAWRRHMACMTTALISSTGFLAGYIIYHVHVGEKSSGYRGWIAAIYFPMLASHVLLAFATLPLVILTLIPVFRSRWDRHRRIARWRSEEHTSELQSHSDLVCRLLLEKKKKKKNIYKIIAKKYYY